MTEILYDFENISLTLEQMTKTIDNFTTISNKINSLTIDYEELSSLLERSKSVVNKKIENIIDILETNIKMAKAVCEEYLTYENETVVINELLNRQFKKEEIIKVETIETYNSDVNVKIDKSETIKKTNSDINVIIDKVENKIYTIKSGDTLTKIAKKYNVSINDIVAANPNIIKNINLIYAGSKIIIPNVVIDENNNNNHNVTPNTENIERLQKSDNSSKTSETRNVEEINSDIDVKSEVVINYQTGSINGNSIVAGSSGYTINEVLSKIKQSCEKNGIGEYWVDVCAISLWETGNYKSQAFIKNNPGGLSYANGLTRYSFNTLEDGIESFVSNLSRNYYAQGRNTLDAISTKYCPGTAQNWAKNVKIMKNQIQKCI